MCLKFELVVDTVFPHVLVMMFVAGKIHSCLFASYLLFLL
jgi:hypothetical protein